MRALLLTDRQGDKAASERSMGWSARLVGAPPFAAGVRTPRGGRAGGEGGRGAFARGSSCGMGLGWRSDAGPDAGRAAR